MLKKTSDGAGGKNPFLPKNQTKQCIRFITCKECSKFIINAFIFQKLLFSGMSGIGKGDEDANLL